MNALLDTASGLDGTLPGPGGRRPAAARTGSWLREVERAWQALRQGGSGGGAPGDVPAEAGPHATRAGTTRYSAPAHAVHLGASLAFEDGGSTPGWGMGQAEAPVPMMPSASHHMGAAGQAVGGTSCTPVSGGAPAAGHGTRAAAAKMTPSKRAHAAPEEAPPIAAMQGVLVAASVAHSADAAPFREVGAPTMPVSGAQDKALAHAPGAPRAMDDAGAPAAAPATLSPSDAPAASRRPSALPSPFAGNGLLVSIVQAASAWQPAALQAAAIQPNGAAGQAQTALPPDRLGKAGQPDGEAAEADAPAAAQPEDGDDYAGKNVHVHVDEEGIHAYVRDAGLADADVFAIARAIYEQGMFGQASLASLTVNGTPVPRSAQRSTRTLTGPIADDVHAGTDGVTPTHPFEPAGASHHVHQRR